MTELEVETAEDDVLVDRKQALLVARFALILEYRLIKDKLKRRQYVREQNADADHKLFETSY